MVQSDWFCLKIAIQDKVEILLELYKLEFSRKYNKTLNMKFKSLYNRFVPNFIGNLRSTDDRTLKIDHLHLSNL